MLQGFGGFLFYRVIFRSKLAKPYNIKGFARLCILRAYYAPYHISPALLLATVPRILLAPSLTVIGKALTRSVQLIIPPPEA